MKIKEFIKKLQGLPETQRKIIMWVIVGIFAVVLFSFWFNSLKKNLEKADFSNYLAPLSSSLKDANSEGQVDQIKEEGQKVLDQINQFKQEQQNTKEEK
jgi:hypothetical protein